MDFDDVIPVWMARACRHAQQISAAVPLPPYRLDRATTRLPMSRVGRHRGLPVSTPRLPPPRKRGWTLVDGIADSSMNLFSGHGYCAADNWIRRASGAALLRPWNPLGSALTTARCTDGARYQRLQVALRELAPDIATAAWVPPTPPSFGAPDCNPFAFERLADRPQRAVSAGAGSRLMRHRPPAWTPAPLSWAPGCPSTAPGTVCLPHQP
jgi:hypothetical protein